MLCLEALCRGPTLVLFNSPLPPAPGPSGPFVPGAWCDMCGCAGLALPGLLAWWSWSWSVGVPCLA